MDFGEEIENTEGISKLKFADDGTIKVSKPNTADSLQTMNHVLMVMKNWCFKWRMVINCSPNKTQIICFHSAEGDKSLIPESFKLGQNKVKVVSKTKVLGVIIDQDLSYKAHSEYIYSRLLTKWVLVAKYSNKNWGFNQRVMTQLLKTIFLSCLYYAGHIWITRKNLQEIEKLWYKMIKSAVGAVFNVSQVTAELILGIPPLDITNHINKIKHYLKLNFNNSNHDRLTRFLCTTLQTDDRSQIPSELSSTMKDVFTYLKWRIDQGEHKMNENDIKIIISNELKNFFSLSPQACSYTKNTIKKYTEYVWKKKISNIYLSEGQYIVPNPSCQPLGISSNVSRKTEVLIMSLFYENNLMNDFLWRRSLTESPLCPHCQNELQTPYHAMIQCDGVDVQLRTEAEEALVTTLGEEKARVESVTTLLNASRSPKFMNACKNIIENYSFRHEIQLKNFEE